MDESALRSALARANDGGSLLHRELLAWTWLVAFGVLLEIVFVIWEYVEDLHDFRRGIIHPPDKPNLALFVLGLVGAALVAIGVTGELYAESKIATFETCIRQGNDTLSLLLSKEAGDAAKSAKTAQDIATDLSLKYEAASRELAELRAKAMPRRLSSAQKAILRKDVARFKTKNISLSCEVANGNGATEALDFELDFLETFSSKSPIEVPEHKAWCTSFEGVGFFLPSFRIEYGLQREGDELILLRALEDAGIKKKDVVIKKILAVADAKRLTIVIGPRPR
jgi:hypothetical protein